MWTCAQCGEELADRTISCWRCGTPRTNKATITLEPANIEDNSAIQVIPSASTERVRKTKPKTNPLSVVVIIVVTLLGSCFLIAAVIFILALL